MKDGNRTRCQATCGNRGIASHDPIDAAGDCWHFGGAGTGGYALRRNAIYPLPRGPGQIFERGGSFTELTFHLKEGTLTEWQPITTAPKDGTRILIARFAWHTDTVKLPEGSRKWYWRIRQGHYQGPRKYSLAYAISGFWSAKWGNWNDGVEPAGLHEATHWMPLPDPPKTE